MLQRISKSKNIFLAQPVVVVVQKIKGVCKLVLPAEEADRSEKYRIHSWDRCKPLRPAPLVMVKEQLLQPNAEIVKVKEECMEKKQSALIYRRVCRKVCS